MYKTGDKDYDFVLMQYTGLQDKNAKEIYEGDILRVYSFNFNTSGPIPDILNVVFNGGAFELYRGDSDLMGLRTNYIKECEVIGNIYESEVK
jgi:uncharacterized phage protein (TIGR01671 family)